MDFLTFKAPTTEIAAVAGGGCSGFYRGPYQVTGAFDLETEHLHRRKYISVRLAHLPRAVAD